MMSHLIKNYAVCCLQIQLLSSLVLKELIRLGLSWVKSLFAWPYLSGQFESILRCAHRHSWNFSLS